MFKKLHVRIPLLFAILISLYSCSPETLIEYKGEIKALIVDYSSYEETLVITYILGSTQMVDELEDVSNAHVSYFSNLRRKEVPLGIEVSSSSGGG